MSTIIAYKNLVKNEKIVHSQHQIQVIERLEDFDRKIKLFNIYQGIYLYGDIGRGKTFLIDLYFNNSKIKKKKRIHYHELIQEVHGQLKLLRSKKDPIYLIGNLLAKKVKLLFIDELYIHDIADAMILSRLFISLIKNRTSILITSNCHPTELYQDGLQRENFLPTIELIQKKMKIIRIGGEYDHRLQNTHLTQYFINDDRAFYDHFQKTTQQLPPTPKTFNINGRLITIEKTVKQIAWCTFTQLCTTPLASGDYQMISKYFTTIFLSKIKTIEDRNELKRFIILIDELYEHKIQLFCSATCKITSISQNAIFARTSSRLNQMCSTNVKNDNIQIFE